MEIVAIAPESIKCRPLEIYPRCRWLGWMSSRTDVALTLESTNTWCASVWFARYGGRGTMMMFQGSILRSNHCRRPIHLFSSVAMKLVRFVSAPSFQMHSVDLPRISSLCILYIQMLSWVNGRWIRWHDCVHSIAVILILVFYRQYFFSSSSSSCNIKLYRVQNNLRKNAIRRRTLFSN